MGGAEATAQIRSAMATPPKVLVVTNYDTDADILGAIEAGAVGYLLRMHHRTSCCPQCARLRRVIRRYLPSWPIG